MTIINSLLHIFDDMTNMQKAGNIICFAGAVIMILVGFIKSQERIIAVQCAQFGLMGIGNLIIGGISGFISNLVSIIRNLIVFKTKKLSIALKIFFIALQGVLTAFFDFGNPYALLPFLATVIFTIFLDTKDARILKLAIIAGEILWVFYDLHNRNYASFIMDLITIISNITGLIAVQRMMKKGRNKESV